LFYAGLVPSAENLEGLMHNYRGPDRYVGLAEICISANPQAITGRVPERIREAAEGIVEAAQGRPAQAPDGQPTANAQALDADRSLRVLATLASLSLENHPSGADPFKPAREQLQHWITSFSTTPAGTVDLDQAIRTRPDLMLDLLWD